MTAGTIEIRRSTRLEKQLGRTVKMSAGPPAEQTDRPGKADLQLSHAQTGMDFLQMAGKQIHARIFAINGRELQSSSIVGKAIAALPMTEICYMHAPALPSKPATVIRKKPASRKKTVRLAILGTGGMANVHAENFARVAGCEIVAAADVDPERVRDFCEKQKISNSFSGVKELLAGSDFDAVTIVTPDAFHAPLAISCLKAGKHVLCEKPLAVTYPDARKMVAAAQRAGVINMVNFSYRNWPAIQGIAKLVTTGKLGEIRHVEASYLQAWLASKVWGDWRQKPGWLWRLSSKHGSKGVLGDVGVHIVDFATYPVGPISSVYCQLKTFAKAPGNRIGEYPLDANDSAILTVEFKNGAIGTINTTRWCGGHKNRLFLRIAGTKGTVEFDSDRSKDGFRLCAGKGFDTAEWTDVEIAETPSNYQRFISGILSGKNDQPDFARGAEIQKVLDACFVSDAERRPVRV